MTLTEFQPGTTYTNRKGTFTVLAVSPPTMQVRWADGLEETLNIAIQQRILSNMTLPPRTPEPPPRRRTGPAVSLKAEPAPPRARAAGTPSVTRPAPAAPPRTRRATAAPTLTLAQLTAMSSKEQQKARHDGLTAMLQTAAAFSGLLDRSREAEKGRFSVLPVEQVIRLHAGAPPPTPQEPEAFLAHAIATNRAYLAAEGQEILVAHYPLYEAGSERYLIDLLCYDERGRRAILVCINTKTTLRRWLWEALLDSLRNWAATVATASFADALGVPVDTTPVLAVLGPRSFWADNAPGAGAHTDEVAAGHVLNRRLLTAMEDWARLPVLLLQVPDDWLRTADQLDYPPISAAPFPRGHAG